MTVQTFKWIYTFFLLVVTVSWAAFTVLIIRNSIIDLSPVSVMEASGSSALMGALIAWCGNINQHWFRKATYNEEK